MLKSGIAILCEGLSKLRTSERSLYLTGNGGSAGVASHVVTDFFDLAKLKAMTLHESSLMTCMFNDVLIATRSSGKSTNIRNAATEAAASGSYAVTFSGFASDNPPRSWGDLNLWRDSSYYGHVDIGHQFLLHNFSDGFGAGTEG